MSGPEAERTRLMRERVVAKALHYLRPPDPNDKWWETLSTTDAGAIDRRLDASARSTPVTVNQCALSPMKNVEASRNLPMALPIGVAFPTKIGNNQVRFQLGLGAARNFPMKPIDESTLPKDNQSAPVAGAQITGSF